MCKRCRCTIDIDPAVNGRTRGTETVISTPESRVKVVVVPTDEELVIARDTRDIVTALGK